MSDIETRIALVEQNYMNLEKRLEKIKMAAPRDGSSWFNLQHGEPEHCQLKRHEPPSWSESRTIITYPLLNAGEN